ncbi:MAG TPA: penicillin-binding transpeptidase domain-containing protein [Solirubrobacteraceae bacterium]|nr:penicillin-binding transpeptidase domain-containing protein [Solirubrobacteraceae bacterium]
MSGGYYTPEDRRPPITPGLAFRVAALGFVALALFAIIFFRLWYLQVLAGDRYVQQANQNRVRDVAIPAPRGEIVDRDGRVLVSSKLANVVGLDPRRLPESELRAAANWGRQAGDLARRYMRAHPKAKPEQVPLPAVPDAAPALARRFERIGHVVGMTAETMQRRVIQSLAVLPYQTVVLRSGVPRTMIEYLQERRDSYPGVTSNTVSVRDYPHGTLAAQLLGYVGQVNERQLKSARFAGVAPGTVVGQNGVEAQYDRYLRGTDGIRRLQVDSSGNFTGELTNARRDPQPGRDLKLTIDLGLQQAGEKALQTAIATARQSGEPASGGAFVVMDPSSGALYAMGSAPTYKPSTFTGTITEKKYRELTSDAYGKPLLNRATSGVYPTGSTFKPITALAALQDPASGITPSWIVDDTGCTKISDQELCNAKKTAYGRIDMTTALQVSSDIYFYRVAAQLNSAHTETIQDMARSLGLGRHTGVDLPTGAAGLVPDWRWREQQSEVEAACRKRKGIPLGFDYSVYEAAARGCGISDMRPWSIGDNINLAVGQGDLQATPLQMAVAYSTIVNGGKVPRPHLGMEIDRPNGNFLQQIQPGSTRKAHVDPSARATVLNGLHLAASTPAGTSGVVWAGWDQSRFPVYGKTGTAQSQGQTDQSWYICWVRDADKPDSAGIVIAVTVEKAGFGAASAAPVARMLASRFYTGHSGAFVPGDSGDR